MNAITILAAIVCITVVVLPAAAELARISADRSNPLRRLRIPTRRNQVQDMDPSSSFA